MPEAVRAGRASSGSPTAGRRRDDARPRWSCPTAATGCRPGPCWACPPRPTASTGCSPPTASRGCGPRRALPPLRLDGDVAVGRAAARAAGRRGGRPAGRAAARRGLRRPGRRAVAGRDDAGAGGAAAARRLGARRRGRRPRRRRPQPGATADGPVFATRARRARLAAAALVAALPAPDGAAAHARAHGLRRAAGGFELSVGPAAAPELLTADAVVVAVPARQGGPAAGRGRAGRRRAAARASRTPRWPWWRWPSPAQDAGRRVGAAGAAGDRAAGQGRDGLVAEVAAPGRRRTCCWCGPRSGGSAARSELQRSDDDLTAAVVADVAELLDLRPARARWRPAWCAGAGGCRSTWWVTRPGRAGPGRGRAVPGLAVAGAAFDGVGVPACIRGRPVARGRRACC